MNKISSAVYLFSNCPLFNKEAAPSFETFNKENSIFLYETMVLNHIENLKEVQSNVKFFYCFDEVDGDLLPREINSRNDNLFFGDTKDSYEFIKRLADKHFSSFNNNLLIFYNSIGVNGKIISKALDLISIDDDAIIIGKTNNDSVAFIGFNSFHPEIYSNINFNLSCERILKLSNKYDSFIHCLKNYMKIDSIDDFKMLYRELSKKESLAYCSQHIHERFTNLFIEYKDLLK